MAVTIGGSTRLVGVMGWPVAHSRSPAMHNAAFAALGLDYVYVPLPVEPGRLESALRGLVALGFAGANVTVPHKEAVLPFLDALTGTAAVLRAANTLIVRPNGTLLGDNTDGAGFLADLRGHGYAFPRDEDQGQLIRSALVLGAGGAARAVVYALAEAGAAVAVANRTPARAEALCAAVSHALPAAHVTAHGLPADLGGLAERVDLIVNATSLGMHGAENALPWDPDVPFRSGQTVYDLVYPAGGRQAGARPTPLLALAAAGGARTFDGLGMLVHQGVRAFELWTGHKAPVQVMMDAVR